jgi:hypothetical protein
MSPHSRLICGASILAVVFLPAACTGDIPTATRPNPIDTVSVAASRAAHSAAPQAGAQSSNANSPSSGQRKRALIPR